MFKFVVVLVPLTTGVTGFIHGVFPGLNQQAQLLLTYGSSPLRPADEDTGPSDPALLLWTRRLDAGFGVQLWRCRAADKSPQVIFFFFLK